MLAVSLEGLDNILNCGSKHYTNEEGDNIFALIVEQCEALEDLEILQSHPNHSIYNGALTLIQKFFNEEDEDDAIVQALNNPSSFSDNETNQNTDAGGLFDATTGSDSLMI